jgi:outer membrane protein assembly factor BamB
MEFAIERRADPEQVDSMTEFPVSKWKRVALAAGVLAVMGVQAADWPSYRGPLGNGHSPEKISRAWPEGGPKVLWRVPSRGGFSSFAVAGGRAVCLELREFNGVEQEAVVARAADTGKEQWVQPLGTLKINDGGQDGAAGNKGGDGPRSTPAVDGGRVYTLSAKLVLQGWDAATGKEVWKHDLVKEFAGRNISWQNAQSPVVEGDLVIVAGGGAGQSLLAFDKKTGEVKWKGFDETMTHSTPVVGEILGQRQAVFFLKSGLLAVDLKTGAELWRYTFPFAVSTAISPVIAGDVVYCSAGYGVGAGAARITREGNVWKATEIYRKPGNKPLANHWSTPVLFDGHLFGMFQFKEYGSGPVKCVDVKTGDVKWEKAGFGPGHVIGIDRHVLALSDSGELVLIEAATGEYKEVARADVLPGKCWPTPVVAGGPVFARSAEEAVCLDVAPRGASR